MPIAVTMFSQAYLSTNVHFLYCCATWRGVWNAENLPLTAKPESEGKSQRLKLKSFYHLEKTKIDLFWLLGGSNP